ALRLHFHHLRHGKIGGRDARLARRAPAARARRGTADRGRGAAQDYAPAVGETRGRGTNLMITTHVLDTARGRPALSVTASLALRPASEWTPVGRGVTDEKGRVITLTSGPISPGAYRLTFDVAAYQREMGFNVNFFPEVRITFNVKDTEDHYHIPLLLSPFGYTTYRGA